MNEWKGQSHAFSKKTLWKATIFCWFTFLYFLFRVSRKYDQINKINNCLSLCPIVNIILDVHKADNSWNKTEPEKDETDI